MYAHKIVLMCLLFLYSFLIPSVVSQEYSVDEHTLALWHFDEDTGQVVYDVANSNNGIIIDTSGNKNNLRIDSGTGKSIKFVGQNYITIPDNIALNFGVNDSFTIEALFRSNSASDQRIVYKQLDSQGNNGYAIFMGSSEDGVGKITGIIWSNGKLNRVATTKTYNDGRWHHVAFVRDTSNHKLLLYMDGNIDHSIDETLNGSLNNSANLFIGTSNIRDFPYFFHGLIDEVRISNIARTKFNINFDNLSEEPLDSLEFVEAKAKEPMKYVENESFSKTAPTIEKNTKKKNYTEIVFILIIISVFAYKINRNIRDNTPEVDRKKLYQKKQVKEYKRKCNECGKIWHSLASREEEIQKDIKFNSRGQLFTAFIDPASATQSKRNVESQIELLDKLKRCPNCSSHNYTETVNIYEKK